MANDGLTAVIIAYRKNRLNHRLVFGSPILTIRRGWRREIALFAPHQVFAYERWRADWYGTQGWRLFVCAAVKGGAVTRVPGVLPGVQLLLSTSGKRRVKRALEAIAIMTSRHDNAEIITPSRWRRLHNEIETGELNLDQLRAER